MARIFTDGAEMNDLLFWDSAGGTTIKYDTPDPFDGDYYYRVASTSNNKIFPAKSEIYFRYRIYFAGLDGRDEYPRISESGNVNANTVVLTINGSAELIVTVFAANYAENTNFRIQTGQWYLFEIYVKTANSPDGHVTLKIDGTEIMDWSGDTMNGSSTISQIGFSTYTTIYIDDLALNDTTGGVDDSWCGDGSVVKVTPNGNGAHNNWHGSDSNDVDNYLLVDEYGHDGDTTYVYHDSSASGTQDQYAMSDYSGAGYTITRVFAEARARLSAASPNQIKIGILPSGSTDQMSDGISLPAGAYTRIVGDDYLVNPADAGAWEEADIDALEGVIEVA